MTVRHRAGRVELSVLRDLREMNEPDRAGKRGALAESAVTLARALDSGPAVGHVAKLVTELRVVLGQLREVARERGDGSPAGDLSSPSWDAAESGASDVGAAGGGGGSAAG